MNAIETKRKYGKWSQVADKNDFKKYFRARGRVTIGTCGDSNRQYDILQFHRLDLTTKMGEKNTFEDMVADFKKLNRWFKSKGYNFEYCGCPELSPENKLVHLHMLYRSDDIECLYNDNYWIKASEISQAWDRYHGAIIIEFKPVWDNGMNKWIEYISKHISKEYPETSALGFRMLTSHGWLPEHCELVNRMINKDIQYEISKGGEKQECWEKAGKLFQAWAGGKQIENLWLNERYYNLKGKKVIHQGENKHIINFAYEVGLIKK